MRSTKTKPKQAGSARSLDRWELFILTAMAQIDNGFGGSAKATLARLLRSIRRAERR